MTPRTATILLIFLATLPACGGRYVEAPQLRSLVPQTPEAPAAPDLAPPDADELREALAALVADPGATRDFHLCEADPATGTCPDPDDALNAAGLGGVAIPLVLALSRLSIGDVEPDGDGWTLESTFRTRVNGIPPICTRATGELTINESGSANLEYGGFYCNWILIGNVVTRLRMSVDRIDLREGSFAGYYDLRFNGTGNAGGSGYYRATPLRREADES